VDVPAPATAVYLRDGSDGHRVGIVDWRLDSERARLEAIRVA
jgi:hypothetical protein